MNTLLKLSILIGCTFILSCDPQEDDKIDIGAPPSSATFSIQESADEPNTYIFTNTTAGAFQYIWDLGNGQSANGETIEAFYDEKGDYEITLTIFTSGGHASGSQLLTVPEDAPFDCESAPVYKFLSNCDTKTWRLNPVEGSLWIGPADGSQTWWSISQSDIDARPCAYNDEWTFTVDGDMVYDTKGDFFAEDYMGFDFECIDEAELSPDQAAWGAGTHSFSVLPGTPPQLMLSGAGAYIGLPKAVNGAEVTLPRSSVTYDIINMEENPDGDFMELEINVGAGVWKFQLISD